MHATEVKGVEFASYQLKGVANVWYNQWEEGLGEEAEPAEWDELERVFLDYFFSQELREEKIEKFVNLKPKGLIIKEYILKFIQLSRYTQKMVQDISEG